MTRARLNSKPAIGSNASTVISSRNPGLGGPERSPISCQTNTYSKIRIARIAVESCLWQSRRVKSTKSHTRLPIGPTARITFEIDATRAACSRVAQAILNDKSFNEAELEECARLDDALAQAHRLLKATVRSIMLSRLK